MSRILPTLAIVSLTACQNLSTSPDNYRVLVAELEWVKLYPSEPAKEVRQDGEIVELIISNSCGSAEASYISENGQKIRAWMPLGEWCRNPFQKGKRQLLVIGEDDLLKEYYGVSEDSGRNEFVIVDDWSILKPLSSPLNEAVFLGEIEAPDDEEYLSEWVEAGDIVVKDGEAWQIKGVFLKDALQKYAP